MVNYFFLLFFLIGAAVGQRSAVSDVSCAFSSSLCRWVAVSGGSSQPDSGNGLTWRIGTSSSSSDRFKAFAVTKVTLGVAPAIPTTIRAVPIITTTPRRGGYNRLTTTTTRRGRIVTTQRRYNIFSGVDEVDDNNDMTRYNNRQKRQTDEQLTSALISPAITSRQNNRRDRVICFNFWYSAAEHGQLNIYRTNDADLSSYQNSPLYSSGDNNDGQWRQVQLPVIANGQFKLKIEATTSASDNGVKVAAVKLTLGHCLQRGSGGSGGSRSDTLKPVSTGTSSRGLLSSSTWPDNKIPYEIDQDSSFTSGDRSAISKAIATINQLTCVKFVNHNNEDDFILFKQSESPGCYSVIGYLGGQLDAELGSQCLTNSGEMMHLMMHILGFQHEHQRPDRDDFVTVDYANVIEDASDQFSIDYNALKVGEYDYTSVTHYGPFAYAVDRTQQTLTPAFDTPQSRLMGQRYGLSFGDINAVNEAYSCSTTDRRTCSPACRNGGTCQGPDFCVCRGGYTGQRCETFGGDDISIENDCENGGTKQRNGLCSCPSGYIGQKCETPSCSPTCQNGGTCSAPNTCSCRDGYIGDWCETKEQTNIPDCTSDDDCNGQNGQGVCSPSTGLCRCGSGWQGRYCNTPVCSGGCGSYGRCTAPNQCTCNPGYGGAGCAAPMCDGGCGDHGDCIAPGVCRCRSGWGGVGCDTAQCTQGCVNGQCTAPNYCTCIDGYGGPSCNTITKPTVAYGGRCIDSPQCMTENSHCELISASCKEGLCACKPGYSYIDGRCLLPKRVGEKCTAPDVGCTENSECSSEGVCTCSDGYKRGPLNRCARDTANKIFDDDCNSPSECYYDLTCKYGKCVCPPGTVQQSDYSCRTITYGDPCTSDTDCSLLDRAICSESGVCQCDIGYVKANYTMERGGNATTCIKNDNIQLGKGSSCPVSHEQICIPGYACIVCRNSNEPPRCLWPGKPIKIVMVGIPIYGRATTATGQYYLVNIIIGIFLVLLSF